ncbi:MAG: YabP/YqfC family sporulation protein [Bacillota bacterium]|nr:YabP/YqfC family sporulation protein [Bacillota bacterium]
MEGKEHNIKIAGRQFMEISGVLQADSSEEKQVNLRTSMGEMVIEGEGLQIRHLDLNSGNAVVSGKVNAVLYPVKEMRSKGKKNGITRFFK